MRTLQFKISKETMDSQRLAGRYNPANVATWHHRRKRYQLVLHSGDSDTVLGFTDEDNVIFVSINRTHGYCGIVVNDRTQFEEIDSVRKLYEVWSSDFYQNDQDIVDILGKRGLELSDRTIAIRLYNRYLECQ
jgi:hypothetical protein